MSHKSGHPGIALLFPSLCGMPLLLIYVDYSRKTLVSGNLGFSEIYHYHSALRPDIIRLVDRDSTFAQLLFR